MKNLLRRAERRRTKARHPRLIKSLALGAVTGLLGVFCCALPPVERLELDLGLDALFHLRGPRAAPEEAVIVSMDAESSRRLGLVNDPEVWPRSLHARLVDALAAEGARVIVFDVIFAQPRDRSHDRAFAKATRAAGNVVLFEYLQREPVTDADGEIVAADLGIERRVPPVEAFARAAAAVAPFPLPKVPAKVSQAWLFKPGAGDVATLPVAALQHYTRPHYPALAALIRETWSALRSHRPPPPLPGAHADTMTQTRKLGRCCARIPRLAPRYRRASRRAHRR